MLADDGEIDAVATALWTALSPRFTREGCKEFARTAIAASHLYRAMISASDGGPQ